uniref:Uncharacterized protein n=1 Tax=Salmonella sp. TaxID=599 RepID=A0A482EW50_SALSP|nr:hypothetical protein NNIBIDOC_00170 [Salmonella sp.]
MLNLCLKNSAQVILNCVSTLNMATTHLGGCVVALYVL